MFGPGIHSLDLVFFLELVKQVAWPSDLWANPCLWEANRKKANLSRINFSVFVSNNWAPTNMSWSQKGGFKVKARNWKIGKLLLLVALFLLLAASHPNQKAATRIVQTLNRKTVSAPNNTQSYARDRRTNKESTGTWRAVGSLNEAKWKRLQSHLLFPSAWFLYSTLHSRPLGQGVSLSMHLYSFKQCFCSEDKFGKAFSKFLSERYSNG